LLKLRIDEAFQLFSGEVDSVAAPAIGLDAAHVTITRDDFIKSTDNYLMKILVLAQRFFAGEKELWI